MSQRHKPDADDRVRASRALERRLAGHTYADIASEMGYASEAGPRNAVDRLLKRIETEGVAELRRQESLRLDVLQSACWDQAISGDLDAIKTVLQVHAARSKLLGLAAPVAVDVAVSPGVTSQTAVEIVEDARRRLLAAIDAEVIEPKGIGQ